MRFSTLFNLTLFKSVDVLFDFWQNGFSHKTEEIKELKNVFYAEGSESELQSFDAYLHPDEIKRPFIFYVHGGGFVAGDKNHRRRMCREAAKMGFNVFCVNHSLAPKVHFPGGLEDLDAAMCYIASKADEYHLDLERSVIGGDSSGGYWAALFTTSLINEELKEHYKVKYNGKFRYAFFNCGLYDLNVALSQKTLFDISKGLYFDIFGKEYVEGQENDRYVSSVDFVTSEFPKSFLIYAEKDYFCTGQAETLMKKLDSVGVEYKEFHSSDKFNNHCFSLNYKFKLSKLCNEQLDAFLKEIVDQ